MLDTDACDGCGLCVPACPRAAITIPRRVTVLRRSRTEASAWARCSRAEDVGLPDAPCRHAFGVRDLDALAADGVLKLNILVGTCGNCAREDDDRPLETRAETHRVVRQSRGERAVDVVLHGSARAFSAALRAESARAEPVDEGRRRLFAAFAGQRGNRADDMLSRALAYTRPEIEPARCTGCDACTHLCPDDALTLEGPPQEAYLGVPDRCSGCALCMDICEAHAIRLVSCGSARPWRLPLDPDRCRLCGVQYHRPSVASGDPTLCRICALRPNGKRLFQVLGQS
jgi:ferredoxin